MRAFPGTPTEPDREALADAYNSWLVFTGHESSSPHPFKAFLAGVAFVRSQEDPSLWPIRIDAGAAAEPKDPSP